MLNRLSYCYWLAVRLFSRGFNFRLLFIISGEVNALSFKMRNLYDLFACRIGLLMASLVICLGVCAQEGSSAYSFLRIPVSSQAFALGGVNISSINPDLSLVDQNPALLGPEIEAQMGLGYMHYLGSSNFASARYGMGAAEHSAWSAGVRFLSYGAIDGYDDMGTPTGQFHPQDLVVDAIYSHDINSRWRGGITMKFVYSHYDRYEAIALATDLGVNYYNPDKDFSFSAVLKNLGGQVKRFEEHYDRLPFDIQLGITKGLGSTPFQLSITAHHLTKWKLPYYQHKDEQGVGNMEMKDNFAGNLFRHLVFGLQFSPSQHFYAALAYNYKTRTDMATYQRNFLSGFSAGVGFRVRAMGFGVAYAQPHKRGSSVMVNFSLNIFDVIPR